MKAKRNLDSVALIQWICVLIMLVPKEAIHQKSDFHVPALEPCGNHVWKAFHLLPVKW